MTPGPNESLGGGVLRDQYGRQVLTVRDENEALTTADTKAAGTVFDAEGRQHIVILDKGGRPLTADPETVAETVVGDIVGPSGWRRRERPGNQRMRSGTQAPSVMASPPTVTYNDASQIASSTLRRFVPPVVGSDVGQYALMGGGPLMYFNNRPAGTGNTTLASPAAAGASTISTNHNPGTGSMSVQPMADMSSVAGTYDADYIRSRETVTISSVTGTGPYTCTLSAPLTKNHVAGDGVVTTSAPAPGYNTGSMLGQIKFPGHAPLNAFEVITDAPTLEFYMYFPNGNQYRLWVDGELVTSGLQTLGVGGAGQPSNNAAGFLTIAFGSRAFRRVRLEAQAIPVGGVYAGPTDTVVTPEQPSTRVAWVSDSYMGGVDGIQDVASRLLGWDSVILDAIGGTGYEADNTVNVGVAARAIYRLPFLTAVDPDIVVVCLGLNDTSGASFATAMSGYLSALVAALPDATVYVVGPWAVSDTVNSTKSAVATAIKAEAATLGVTYIDTILGLGAPKNPWVTGTGKSGSPANNGNADIMIGSDGTHPTTAGINYNGTRIAAEIARVLPY